MYGSHDKATNIRQGDYENSRYYMSLNGRWKFSWVKNPDNLPKTFISLDIIRVDGLTSKCLETGNVKVMELLFM